MYTELEKKIARSFYDMKNRCYNSNCKSYKYYGGRGIIVCDEWLNNKPDKFIQWSIKNGYKPGLSIERIDNDKGYSPENCAWVAMKENVRNKRGVVLSCYDVDNIRYLFYSTLHFGKFDKDRWSKRKLANEYGVSFGCIKKVLNCNRWS